MLPKRLLAYSRRLLPGLALLVTTLILLLSDLPERLDLVLYDSLLKLQYRTPSEEILIIAIDEPSLQQLGRWPWSREVHAELLDTLTEGGVRAVGFDILFAERETDNPAADRLLAEAIARNGRVVLAVAPGFVEANSQISEILPIAELAENAAALGHVDFELDMDGVSRSVFLKAGMGDPHWPAFGFALAQLANPAHQPRQAPAQPEIADQTGLPTGWVRSQLILTPFSGPLGEFKQVSYIDVLAGKVPQASLRNRIILIGSTASGLGDALATPVTWNHRRMPGVEMNANVVNALLDGSAIEPLSPQLRLAVSLGFVLTLYLAFAVLPARRALWILAVGMAAVLLVTFILLIGFRVWFPPITLLLLMGLAYALWSWYQLQSASHAIARLEYQIRHQARHDPVTRLPNREMLQEYLQQAILKADLVGRHLGLLIVSLDRFRQINHRLGRKGGEQLLNLVAERLRKVIRGDDIVARLSADEFAVMMLNLQDEKPIVDMAGRLLHIFHHPLELNGQQFYLSPSIGANLYPEGGKDQDSLLHNTYRAMEKAKHDKTQEFWFYDAGIKIEITDHTDLDDALHLALQRQELVIYYQPQVDATDGSLFGVEALLRWHNPRRGLIPPADFIPIAEDNGLIIPIGKWVLEQACRQAQQWHQAGLTEICMAVNLSAVQFNHPHLVESIAEILSDTGLPAHLLELELTESSLMQDMQSATQTLARLKTLGIQLAIDDFGTGYSSLSYLKSFPMDRIKIDRTFIQELGSDKESAEITLAIIDMAHRLKLSVIAEGVESASQQAFLRRHHCDQLQGFYYGRPLPADEMWEKLAQMRPLSVVKSGP